MAALRLFELLNSPALAAVAKGSFWGDLLLGRQGDVAALERLAARLPWRPHDPAARRALAERAAVAGGWETARRQALIVGLFEALQREDERQRIRFGERGRYVRPASSEGEAESGRQVRPAETLTIQQYYRWLRQQVTTAMEAALLGLPYPAAAGRRHGRPLMVPLDAVGDVEVAAADELTPEDAVLLQELEEERRRLVEVILAVATPQQRRIIEAFLSCPGDWSWGKVARRLGRSPTTIRAQMCLLRRRLAAVGGPAAAAGAGGVGGCRAP